MKIAIASGKGGTGKTTVATNLAYTAANNKKTATTYLDCDVEAPNGHIFLQPKINAKQAVGTMIPEVDEEKCIHCGMCGEICQYSAIVCIGERVLVYPDLCHSCGGCSLVCPVEAITETTRERGFLEVGEAGPINFARGLLNIGEVMSPPVIKKVKTAAPATDLVIIDAPPGTSCPVIESVEGCDFVVLVTEPTPFGLNDLKLAVEMIRALQLPFGVVINRADFNTQETYKYCDENNIEILAEIPDRREIAAAYSRGEMMCTALPEYQKYFTDLLVKIIARI